MNQQNPQAPNLFDLLSRQWQRPSPISDVCFSADGSALAFTDGDGAIAIAATKDREPPESRIRVSGDVGRTTISPRESPPAPMILATATVVGTVRVVPYLGSGFLVGTEAGDVVHLMADGEPAGTLTTLGGAVGAVDHCARTGMTAAASGKDVVLWHGPDRPVALEDGPVEAVIALAFSPDGLMLAGLFDHGITIWTLHEAPSRARSFALSERPKSIRWKEDGKFLAVTLEEGGFGLISMADGRTAIVSGFPSPVRTVCWSAPAQAVATSGAFRTTAWSMSAPPFDGDVSGAFETGRAGMVLVETVAAHPSRPLVASGYADGRIVVASIGTRDELAVRPLGAGVTALLWSGDGQHLAMGAADGSAAIVTFPPQMFK